MTTRATVRKLETDELQDAFMFLPIPGLSGGWSVAVLHGGEYINRWPPSDPRHHPTQEWIKERIREDAQIGADPGFLLKNPPKDVGGSEG